MNTYANRRHVIDYLRRHGSTPETALIRELKLSDGPRFLRDMEVDELIERAGEKWKMPWSTLAVR